MELGWSHRRKEVKQAVIYLSTVFEPVKCQSSFPRGTCHLVNNPLIVLLQCEYQKQGETLNKEDAYPSGRLLSTSRPACTQPRPPVPPAPHPHSHPHTPTHAHTPTLTPTHPHASVLGLAAWTLLRQTQVTKHNSHSLLLSLF